MSLSPLLGAGALFSCMREYVFASVCTGISSTEGLLQLASFRRRCRHRAVVNIVGLIGRAIEWNALVVNEWWPRVAIRKGALRESNVEVIITTSAKRVGTTGIGEYYRLLRGIWTWL